VRWRWLALLALLFGVVASPASAAPIFDAVSTDTSATGSCSFSHTVAVQSDRVLYVAVNVDTNTDVSASATYNSVAMSLVVALSAQQYLAVFQLVAPATGTNTVAVTYTGSIGGVCHARSYYGVDQSTPTGSPVTSEAATGTTVSNDVASATGNLVVDFVGINNNTAAQVTEGAGQTERGLAEADGPATTTLSGSDEAGAATVTMSWSWVTTHRNAHIAFSLNAVGAGATRTNFIGGGLGPFIE
jgi:hypothetical protein